MFAEMARDIFEYVNRDLSHPVSNTLYSSVLLINRWGHLHQLTNIPRVSVIWMWDTAFTLCHPWTNASHARSAQLWIRAEHGSHSTVYHVSPGTQSCDLEV